MENRIFGLIYGQFIGDALGGRYEFSHPDDIEPDIKKDTIGGFLPILGGGVHNLEPGQVTDDTELVMALFHSILQNGDYIKEDVARKYIKWYKSDPFDIGNTTRNALRNSDNYNDVIERSYKNNHFSLSNGCLMRVSPLGILGLVTKDTDMIRICMEDCTMTNPNPIAVDAVTVYVFALKYALKTGDPVETFKKAFSMATTDEVKEIMLSALNKERKVNINGTMEENNNLHMGHLGFALNNAFYQLLHGPDFYTSMVETVMYGGDTDTNACIAGALLGAIYGKSGLPTRWINSIKIYNPRKDKYRYIDQKNIDGLVYNLTSVLHLKI